MSHELFHFIPVISAFKDVQSIYTNPTYSQPRTRPANNVRRKVLFVVVATRGTTGGHATAHPVATALRRPNDEHGRWQQVPRQGRLWLGKKPGKMSKKELTISTDLHG